MFSPMNDVELQWPKTVKHIARSMWTPGYNTCVIVEQLKQTPCILCFNSLHSSDEALQEVLVPGCRDFLPLSDSSISEMLADKARLAVPVHFKGVGWG